jgi:hypothetical protein
LQCREWLPRHAVIDAPRALLRLAPVPRGLPTLGPRYNSAAWAAPSTTRVASALYSEEVDPGETVLLELIQLAANLTDGAPLDVAANSSAVQPRTEIQ